MTSHQGLGSAVCRDIRVARKRVLRLAREQSSRPIAAAAVANPHDGEIITHVMWGGVRVTVDDGWGWILTAVEHWNADGWHVCKRGDRFAVQPISMGLAGLYTAAGAAGGWPCGWITAPSI